LKKSEAKERTCASLQHPNPSITNAPTPLRRWRLRRCRLAAHGARVVGPEPRVDAVPMVVVARGAVEKADVLARGVLVKADDTRSVLLGAEPLCVPRDLQRGEHILRNAFWSWFHGRHEPQRHRQAEDDERDETEEAQARQRVEHQVVGQYCQRQRVRHRGGRSARASLENRPPNADAEPSQRAPLHPS